MISTTLDDFLKEEVVHKPRWYVELSNGEIAIQDDGHPNKFGGPSWLRLKSYVYEKSLNIKQIWLGFRNETTKDFLPQEAEGYFFVNAAGATAGGDTSNFYVFGWLEGEKVWLKKFKIPELVQFQDGEIWRPLEKCNLGLIYNAKIRK